jgi:GGDEF domain-containing protein
VLAEVAIFLQQTLKRPSDYVFRMGGAEFGILTTLTTLTVNFFFTRFCTAIALYRVTLLFGAIKRFVSLNKYLFIGRNISISLKADRNCNKITNIT